jgi:capsular exopolysaccharide synthesis family protein
MTKKPLAQSIIDFYNPDSAAGTEFRRLLHNVTKPINGEMRRSLLVTSATLAEGKSTVAAYLAIVAASHRSLKTLLVDCDLRRPSIHKLFKLPREQGVAEVLEGAFTAEQSFKDTSIETLSIMTAGTTKYSPSDLLDVETVKGFIEQLTFYFDLVIVDSAPVIPVSDPVILAPYLEGVVMVVKAGATQREVISRACEIIRNTDTEIVGVTLNNMKSALPYYYNHRYYGYSYSSRENLR